MRIQSHDWKTYQVIAEDGTILWSFTYNADKYEKFGVDPGLPIFTGAGWYPVYWSKDGKFVYMAVVHGGEGSSTKLFGNAFTDEAGVFRIDVESGELTEIVPELYPGYYAFSFSHDGDLLVYANQTETPVKVKLLERISKIVFDENHDASQMNESEVILKETIIPNQNTTVVRQPGK